jgi:sulfonate transport system substrate-binding protein
MFVMAWGGCSSWNHADDRLSLRPPPDLADPRRMRHGPAAAWLGAADTGLGFITASGAAAADQAKRPALTDALQRFQRAGAWATGHPEAYARVYATLTRLPIEAARVITGRSALRQRPVSAADIAALQQVADQAFEQQMLPAKVDVRAITLQGVG